MYMCGHPNATQTCILVELLVITSFVSLLLVAFLLSPFYFHNLKKTVENCLISVKKPRMA